MDRGLLSTSATTRTRLTDGAPWLEGDCKRRMLRGGTWDWSPNVQRAGYRSEAIVDGYGASFRVVRTLNVQ